MYNNPGMEISNSHWPKTTFFPLPFCSVKELWINSHTPVSLWIASQTNRVTWFPGILFPWPFPFQQPCQTPNKILTGRFWEAKIKAAFACVFTLLCPYTKTQFPFILIQAAVLPWFCTSRFLSKYADQTSYICNPNPHFCLIIVNICELGEVASSYQWLGQVCMQRMGHATPSPSLYLALPLHSAWLHWATLSATFCRASIWM